jgi:hypothetical protein
MTSSGETVRLEANLTARRGRSRVAYFEIYRLTPERFSRLSNSTPCEPPDAPGIKKML